MDVIVWILLATAYLAILVFAGIGTLNKGHWIIFLFGFFMPLLWIIGAFLPPTKDEQTAQARASLH